MKKIWTMRTRAVIAGLVITLVFSAYSYRLVKLHGIGEKNSARGAESRQQAFEREHKLLARRGSILDANNDLLARDIPVSTVIADNSLLNEPEEIAQVLGRHLNLDPAALLTTLEEDNLYIIVKKQVPTGVALEMQTELRERGLRGVRVEHDYRREYPQYPLLAGIVGIANYENNGVIGVELAMDTVLAGKDGYRKVLQDRAGRELVEFSRDEVEPQDGQSVRLTVDMGIQNMVEEQLDALDAGYAPEKASIIVMNPNTGDILAMGSRLRVEGTEETNNPAKKRNPAIMDQFEPGSIFKIVAAAGALNEGLVNANTPINCEYGKFRYGGGILNDIGSYGSMPVESVIAKSSNIGTAKLALMLGPERLYRYVSEFGFGEKTGLGLSGEISGVSHSPDKWSKISITRIPIGQGIAVTPLQMAAGFSVIANGGYLVKPRLVDAITDERGVTFEKQPVVMRRRVISSSTAEQMRMMLHKVVQPGGTGKRAIVNGYHVCGKTGTAQKAAPNGAGYLSGVYVVSFVGFLPRDNPQFVVMVTVDSPQAKKEEYYGGVIAAPAFATLAERIARYLGVPQDYVVTDEAGKPALASARQ